MATNEEDPNPTPPQVGEDAVGSSSAPPPSAGVQPGDVQPGDTTAEPAPTDATPPPEQTPPADATPSTDPATDSSASDTSAGPHPDGISTEDVAATADQPPNDAGNTGGTSAPLVDPDAAVSPTGTANVAGTAQADLSLAPPMVDTSGTNTPAPNLRQPLADGASPSAGAAISEPAQLDPALVDPIETAKARVEGRTSDASLRAADGPHIDEVPADITDGPKPSDAGPERYPFPQGGDVDVATIPTDVQDGEYLPNLTVEDTVTLLEHELVPDRLVGRRALVVDAPRFLIPVDRVDEVWITVRTRDEVNATLSLPLAAVEVHRAGADVSVRG